MEGKVQRQRPPVREQSQGLPSSPSAGAAEQCGRRRPRLPGDTQSSTKSEMKKEKKKSKRSHIIYTATEKAPKKLRNRIRIHTT